ncbi:hypothetical protein SCBWM1_gp106 [Synechococcus phage S-CBWM1]|uniref:Uncharacterized protein n=1 Tax=Synechococcus phage S-CBWM1 TaxID=2053653 RepID=A0A3G1L3R7_9CAUD|nr:hypothetical protein HOU61_gp091 [Synechococcus phage S-CBWM1]ATW62790.1 hypothetical protein SCBWM1_gp106 [Synechococcus phage S-CBWM1]
MSYSKRCQKGKSCGSACIFIRKNCISEFPEDVSRGLNIVRDLLNKRVEAGAIDVEMASLVMDRMTRGNQNEFDPVGLKEESWKEWEVGWTAERTAELETAISDMRTKFPGDEEFKQKMTEVVDFSIGAFGYEREKVTPPTSAEIEALARNRKTIEELSSLTERVMNNPEMTLDQTRSALMPYAEARRTKEVSDEEVRAFVAMLPTQERNYLRNAGALGTKDTGGIFPDNPRSNAVPVRNGPLDLQTKQEANNRMMLFGRIFMEEDGRDCYTRQKIHITECDMEHIIPESIGGKRSEQGVNYGFLKSSMNQIRSNKPQKVWLDAELGKHEWEADGVTLKPASRKAIDDERETRIKATAVKNDFYRSASQAKNQKDLEELNKIADAQTDKIAKTTLKSKLVALSLGVRSTATIGLTSNLRGQNIWNWYGPRFSGGDRAANLLAEKRVEIANDPAKVQAMTRIMRSAQKRMDAYVRRAVDIGEGAINPKTGKPDFVVKGEKRKEMTKAIDAIREEILNEILAL